MKQDNSSVTSTGIDAEISQNRDSGSKLLKKYRQHQNKIDKQELQIKSLQSQNE